MVTMTRAKFPMLTTANAFLRISPTQRVRAFRLALAGLLSLAIYIYAFVQPYHLARWWSYAQRTIAKITGYDQSVGILYVLAMAALFVLYGYACRAAQGRHPALTWAVVILGIIAFNVALLQLYPVDSNDIFDYIIRARMTAYYGANPFYRVPAEFPTDPFQAYNGWDRIPSAYGPLWELIAAAGAWIGGNAAPYRDTLIRNVLVFKLIAVLGYAGTALVIGLILRRHAPERALVGVVLFAWNPLVIYVTAGNGHNDAVMAFFIVLGCYWLLRRRFTLAALAQTAGALVKFVSILLVPIVVITALRQFKTWRERGRYVLVTGTLCGVLVAMAYAPFWQGGDILGLGRRGEMFTTSLPAVVRMALEPGLGARLADHLAAYVGLFLLAAWLIRQLRRVGRSDDLWVAVRASLSLVLFYLLVSILWFQWWYVVWPLALAALMPGDVFSRGAMLFSFAALWKMPVYDFLLMYSPKATTAAYWEYRITPATLGVPWVYFAWQAMKARLKAYAADLNRWRQRRVVIPMLPRLAQPFQGHPHRRRRPAVVPVYYRGARTKRPSGLRK